MYCELADPLPCPELGEELEGRACLVGGGQVLDPYFVSLTSLRLFRMSDLVL